MGRAQRELHLPPLSVALGNQSDPPAAHLGAQPDRRAGPLGERARQPHDWREEPQRLGPAGRVEQERASALHQGRERRAGRADDGDHPAPHPGIAGDRVRLERQLLAAEPFGHAGAGGHVAIAGQGDAVQRQRARGAGEELARAIGGRAVAAEASRRGPGPDRKGGEGEEPEPGGRRGQREPPGGPGGRREQQRQTRRQGRGDGTAGRVGDEIAERRVPAPHHEVLQRLHPQGQQRAGHHDPSPRPPEQPEPCRRGHEQEEVEEHIGPARLAADQTVQRRERRGGDLPGVGHQGEQQDGQQPRAGQRRAEPSGHAGAAEPRRGGHAGQRARRARTISL